MVQYLPPNEYLSIFNSANFPTKGTNVVKSDQDIVVLQAQTDALTTSINAERDKFNQIVSFIPTTIPQTFIVPFNYTGALFATYPSTVTFQPFPSLPSTYYWIASFSLNFIQQGTPISLQAIEGTNNWTNTVACWTGFGTDNNYHPAMNINLLALGTNSVPTFTFNLPVFNSAYATNPNTFNVYGWTTLIGIQKDI